MPVSILHNLGFASEHPLVVFLRDLPPDTDVFADQVMTDEEFEEYAESFRPPTIIFEEED